MRGDVAQHAAVFLALEIPFGPGRQAGAVRAQANRLHYFANRTGLDQLTRVNRGTGLEVLGILLTMFDRRNNLSFRVWEEVTKCFDDTVFKTVIPRNVKLSESPSHGKPALLYDISSRGAESYLRLASEILEKRSEA